MKHKIIHKIFSTVLTVLVLLSTVSFTLEKHFCGEVLIDVAVFSHPESCGSNLPDGTDIVEQHCCKDVVEILKGQDQLKKTSFEELSYAQQFVATYLHSGYTTFLERIPQLVVPHNDYTPPILVFDIHIRDQVFII
ncbi:hypothetical protein BXY82_0183 [Gelidibacter sediminis]|uniref:Secreted protein n=1 Tax=Gelidibacter sediminis TaxID=1608710 RepID=A0A4R7Q5J2_9FLAO|nr:hypothetical protein [Gelidibacter sediminis]TDU42784.1 hypothetical protein BXY82_0183 [Gelidibacter sediminis]